MDRLKAINKLRDKADISYEEANSVLENNNWDVLDSIVYLEKHKKIKAPSVSIFYTNEFKDNCTNQEEAVAIIKNTRKNNFKEDGDFHGLFQTICQIIDTCNNIFLEINQKGRRLLKIPVTVIIVLILFAFWIIIPLVVVGLFFDVGFLVSSKRISRDKIDKINKAFNQMSKKVKDIKDKFKKEVSDD